MNPAFVIAALVAGGTALMAKAQLEAMAEDYPIAPPQALLYNPQQPAGALAPEANHPTPQTPQTPRWDADPTPKSTPLDALLGWPTVLIYGPQGSGKSTYARHLIEKRIAAGHSVKVLDPHAPFGQWGDLQVVGVGLDYPAIDAALDSFQELVKARYEMLATQPNYSPKPVTLVCEELTNWADRCRNISAFWGSAMADLRKVNAHVLFISHGRDLGQLGGGRGAKMRDSQLLELQLQAAIDPATGKPTPALKGSLKMPGDPIPKMVTIPSLEIPNPAPGAAPQTVAAAPNPVPNPIPQESLTDGLEPHLAAIVEYVQRKAEPVKPRDIQRASLKVLTDCNITKSDQIQLCLDTLAYGGWLDILDDGTYALASVGSGVG